MVCAGTQAAHVWTKCWLSVNAGDTGGFSALQHHQFNQTSDSIAEECRAGDSAGQTAGCGRSANAFAQQDVRLAAAVGIGHHADNLVAALHIEGVGMIFQIANIANLLPQVFVQVGTRQ